MIIQDFECLISDLFYFYRSNLFKIWDARYIIRRYTNPKSNIPNPKSKTNIFLQSLYKTGRN
jgi:hypothetical protein